MYRRSEWTMITEALSARSTSKALSARSTSKDRVLLYYTQSQEWIVKH